MVPPPQKQVELEPQLVKEPQRPGEEQEEDGVEETVRVTVEVRGGRVVVVAVMLS